MAPRPTSAAPGMAKLQLTSRDFSVRLNGEDHQWTDDPTSKVNAHGAKPNPRIVGKILVANEWLDWVTYQIEASHAWWPRELNRVWS
jgi:hypothetical protein